jgi:hypothetical protein
MENPNTFSAAAAEAPRKNHMVIAGTGRAGTSFLVRYLCELGLETEISRSGAAQWDIHANAGFETTPIATPAGDLPYVIKSPWLSEFIEQILAQQNLTLDVVIIPVRDLVEAAASRVILQMRAMHAGSPEMTNFDRTWESWGMVPGGVVFSLNPLDQARILAVGFHRLVQRLIDADIPIVFLSFPRLVTDGEYLFAKLRSFLPAHVTSQTAQTVHNALANCEKVRVGEELASNIPDAMAQSAIFGAVRHPDYEQLDHIAIKRELKRLNTERDTLARTQNDLITERNTLARTRNDLISERDALARTHNDLISERDALVRARDDLISERDALDRVRNDLIAERDALVRARDDLISERDAIDRVRNDLIVERDASIRARDLAIGEREAMQASSSWRLTAPLRRLRGLFARVSQTKLRRREPKES